MKVVLQRVLQASVTVDTQIVGAIQHGLCALVGVAHDDTDKDLEYTVKKILQIRLFNNPQTGKSWDKNVLDVDGGILLVSQFTLCHVLKGNKPDFHNAMGGANAKVMFDRIVDAVRAAQPDPAKVQTGQFGEHMHLHILNDGPVTIQLNSRSNDE